jgi:isochorismate synthase
MNTLASVSSLKLTETELLSFAVQYAQETGSPIAFWRLPDSTVRHLIISDAIKEVDVSDMLEDLGPGFMMAPFNKNKNRLFLPADFLFSFEGGLLKIDGDPSESASLLWLQEKLRSYVPKKYFKQNRDVASGTAEDEKKTVFLKILASGIEEIERGNLEKIVPSRTKQIELPETFDIVSAFEKLCKSYPQALISFVHIAGSGSWLGASPEILVSVRDNSIFKTVALAGTLPYHEGINIKSVAWTQKEIEEQALVERYVISCFKKVRLREYEEHGPRTVIAGNLMHLKSEFIVDMKATNFPQMGSVMLKLLHPTSAVCGMPLNASIQFLEKHEGYDRAFYAGYLGPVNVNNDVNLFVNLRCMQIQGSHAILYAGAGVTIDSAAEEEWAETEMKFNTLLKVIF